MNTTIFIFLIFTCHPGKPSQLCRTFNLFGNEQHPDAARPDAGGQDQATTLHSGAYYRDKRFCSSATPHSEEGSALLEHLTDDAIA